MHRELCRIISLAILAVSLTIFPSNASAEASSKPVKIYLSVDNATDYFQMRNLVRLDDATLRALVFSKQSDNHSMHITRSDDYGATWQPLELLATGTSENNCRIAQGSLLNTSNGTLYASYIARSSNGTTELLMMKSLDKGKSWSNPSKIDTGRPHKLILFNGIEMRNGTLLWGYSFNPNPWNNGNRKYYMKCGTLYSTDNGSTWELGGEIDFPEPKGYGCDEPSLVEMPDGSLRCYFRNSLGSIHYSVSYDAGQSWGEPESTPLISPLAPACVKRVSFEPDRVLASWDYNFNPSINDTGSWNARKPLVLSASSDNCQTWSAPVLLTELAASYPSLEYNTDNNSIVVVWRYELAEDTASQNTGLVLPYEYLFAGPKAPEPSKSIKQPSGGGVSSPPSGGGGGVPSDATGAPVSIRKTSNPDKFLVRMILDGVQFQRLLTKRGLDELLDIYTLDVGSFIEKYGMSAGAALETAKRYNQRPKADEFKGLTKIEKQNLMLIYSDIEGD